MNTSVPVLQIALITVLPFILTCKIIKYANLIYLGLSQFAIDILVSFQWGI